MASARRRTSECGSLLSEPDEGLPRRIGLGGLVFGTMASIIGSGWLFGPLYAAQHAGPAAIVAWPIAGMLFALMALCYAELGAMFPVSGGVVRFPHYAFGTVTSAIIGWIIYLGAVTFPAIEVEAALQYATNYVPWLTHKVNAVTVLTGGGYAVAALMMVVFTLVNLLGVEVFVRANNVIMVFKLLVMAAVAVTFLTVAFHADRLTEFGGFAPNGVSGILTAIVSGGVAFAFTGFQQPVAVAGEVRDPGRNIPRALLLGLGITSLIYLVLQLAFLCGLPTDALSHGWSRLGFTNDAGPLAGLSLMLGLGWLATLLYLDAIVSPADCGLNWSMMTSRISYGMAENGSAPRSLARLNRLGAPWISVLVSSAIGLFLFLPFPGWQTFVSFITSAAVLSYGTGPIAHAALRRQLPDYPRPFRSTAGDLVPFLAFYAANLLVIWGGWETMEKILWATAIGTVLFGLRQLDPDTRAPADHWPAAGWIVLWLIGLGMVSKLCTFGKGAAIISFGWSFPVALALSALVYLLAVRTRLPRALIDAAPLSTR
jgi:amino acid transporter